MDRQIVPGGRSARGHDLSVVIRKDDIWLTFETNLRKERQMEGIAKAKAAGVYKGRKPSIDVSRVRKLRADGLGATEIADALKIGRSSVYRVLEEVSR